MGNLLKTPVAEDKRLKRDTLAFYEALAELIRVYQFRDRDRICCHDVSVTQCYALESLARRAYTVNELAARLYLDKSTMSRVIDSLERKGYVTREPHPTDGRSVQIEIAAAGRAVHDRILQEILEEEERMLSAFSPEVRHSMTKVLAELAWTAERRLESAPGKCPPKK